MLDVHESTSPLGYVSILGETGEPTLGLEGGVGCNPRVTFDGKVRNLGPRTFVCVLKFDSPLPEDHRVNRSGVGKSSDGHNEHSRIVLPPETGEQPSLSSGLSDAPWLNRRRPGSLYSIIECE